MAPEIQRAERRRPRSLKVTYIEEAVAPRRGTDS
jgi:hypothetical protein